MLDLIKHIRPPALIAALLFCAGCATHQPGHGNLLDPGPEKEHATLEQKLENRRQPQDGATRWQQFTEDDYQHPDDIEAARAPIGTQRDRQAQARAVLAAGPVPLVDCVILTLEFNDVIQSQRKAIEAVGGDEIIVRSRFLPQLFFDLEQESRTRQTDGSTSSRTDSYFRYHQTLFEFGKDNDEDVALRAAQREALFAYEDAVRETLAAVRLTFYTILLRQQQLAQRLDLLEEFRRQYQRVSKKYDKRQVVEVDVLTARLNMLNEETRINALRQEILRETISLLHLIGLPVSMVDFTLAGATDPFDMSIDKAVETSLRRSTAIAQARATVSEQRRAARQVLWEYAPDLSLQSGWKGKDAALGMEATGTDGAFTVGPFAEGHIDSPAEGFTAGQDVLDPEQEGWFLALALELPIFDGAERRARYTRAVARLHQTQHELRDTIDTAELEVRQDYQTMLEQRQDLEILAETVAISKKRLRAKERLKELARIRDDELETFRERFFQDQDAYFDGQITYVVSQEQLRALMRYFE